MTARPDHTCFVREGAGGLIDPGWCSAAFAPVLRRLPIDPTPADVARDELVLYRDPTLSVCFTPLDHLNPAARVLLVGLTPGRAQARIALRTTIGQLAAGAALDEALAVAKREASFAGPMRRNLVGMLDGIGLHDALGVDTCARLFADRVDLMAATSAVCHPVFLADGANYGGAAPALDRHPVLAAFARQVLGAAVAGATDALVVPLGKAAGLGVRLAGADPARVLEGFPHPSGSNGHRVRQYEQERERLAAAVRRWARSGQRAVRRRGSDGYREGLTPAYRVTVVTIAVVAPGGAVERSLLTPASSYDELWRQVDFTTMAIPERFNLGVACADRQDPDARALTVVERDRTARDHTFGELTEASNRLAHALAALGIGRGDVVGLVSPASFETGTAFVAMFRMGAIALPLSSLFGPDALRFRLRDAGAKAVVTAAANADRVREALDDGGAQLPLLVIGDSYEEALAAASPEFTPVDTAAEDPAFLIYTSGTTGDPKGALHAHRIVFGHLPAFEAVYEFFPQPGDVLWSPADWAWIAGIMDILVPAWFHGLPVVVDREPAFTAERAVWLMREYAVTLTLLPATALRVIRASGTDGGGFAFRAVCSGGEALGADLLKWSEEFFGATVNEGYGQTELNACIGNCASVYPVRPGSLGKALPGFTAVVLDDDGEPVVDAVGELALDRRTPSTMLEYWRNPTATAEKFHGEWLLTGDLARQDTDGYVWFESRKDDVINSAGYRIGPGEIEQSLGGHEAVAMAAVVGVPDERRGEVPKAFVVLRPGVTPSAELADELRAHVRARLAAHEVPAAVEFLDELPRTTTGKIMRRALRQG